MKKQNERIRVWGRSLKDSSPEPGPLLEVGTFYHLAGYVSRYLVCFHPFPVE